MRYVYTVGNLSNMDTNGGRSSGKFFSEVSNVYPVLVWEKVSYLEVLSSGKCSMTTM